MVKIKNNSKGMTLVELLITIALFIIVMGIVYQIYNGNMQLINKENIKTELQNDAQIIDSTFSQLSMESKGVKDEKLEDLNSDELNLLGEDTSGYKKVGNYIVLEYQGKEMKWILEDKKLKLQVISDNKLENEYDISNNIRLFAIKPVDSNNLEKAKMINIKIILEKQKGLKPVQYPLSVVVTLRNKE